MKSHVLASTVALATLVSACGHRDGGGRVQPMPRPQASLISVSDVVNALKCELAETFSGRDYVGTVVKDKVEAELSLSVEIKRSTSVGGGIDASVSVVDIGIGVEEANARGQSDKLTLAFEYDVDNNLQSPAFCASLSNDVRVQGDPFVSLLDGLAAEYGQIGLGSPTVTLTKLSHTAGFEVEREVTTDGEIKVLIFKLGGKNATGRSASQELTLNFSIVLPPVFSPF